MLHVEESPVNVALESALGFEGNGYAKDALVGERLLSGDILMLGRIGPDQQVQSVLYFMLTESDGREVDALPVFTRVSYLRQGVQKNPAWTGWAAIRLPARELLQAVDVAEVVINPWSTLQYRLRLLALQAAIA